MSGEMVLKTQKREIEREGLLRREKNSCEGESGRRDVGRRERKSELVDAVREEAQI